MTTFNESAGGKPAGPLGRLKLPQAGRPPTRRVGGNSTGRAMKIAGHATDAIARTVKARLQSDERQTTAISQASKAPTVGKILPERNTFGPRSK